MQHIEIEYKMLLSYELFQQILKDYRPFVQKDYQQTNDYWTHPILSQKHYMLRIRHKNGHDELTLKRPYQNHRLETNIQLTSQEKELFLNHQLHNEITDILENEGIAIKELRHQFSLTTHRYDIPFQEGLLSLDENTYFCHQDYELEFEITDEKKGYQKFLDIITPYHLHYTHNCSSKVVRAMQAFQKEKS